MERRGEAEVPVAFLPVRFVVLFDSSSLVASLEGRISTGEREKEKEGKGKEKGEEIRDHETHATRPSSLPTDNRFRVFIKGVPYERCIMPR